MKRHFWITSAAALALAGCKKAESAQVYIAVPVERRNIVVAATAAGPIQPILTVAVKSQASGAVTEMHVQTGDDVRPGQLLALIDPRLPKSALDQAQAAVDQAQAQYDYAASYLAREDTLYRAQAETQQNYQSAKVSFEQAKTARITTRSNLDDAQIRFDQTRVTAAMAGTIIEKDVDVGTVISSPTSDVTGGTQMFKMANLDTVQVQAMVDETDVGKVQPGMPVSITVDAYPTRPFQGSVLKIEPQATVNQNVTQFPVDINILNPGHILKPGMNTEVEIHVGTRDSVLTIPNAALRTPQDVASAAQVLGLDPQTVMQELAAQQRAAAPQPTGDTTARGAAASGGTVTMPDGRTVKVPPGVSAMEVRAALTKIQSGGFASLTEADRQLLRKVRDANGGMGRGGPGGGRGTTGGPAPTQQTNYIVFALRHGQPVPVSIKTGLTDLDYVEVTSGLVQGDTVLLLPSASLVQAQQNFKQRIQNFTGGGLPGVKQQTPAQTGR